MAPTRLVVVRDTADTRYRLGRCEHCGGGLLPEGMSDRIDEIARALNGLIKAAQRLTR